MIKLSPAQILSTIFLLLIQILLLKNVQVGLLDRYVVSIFVYPLIIITLPLNFPRSFLTTAAFVIGLIIDLFYDSPGVHTGALVLTAFIRSYVLNLIEPRGGYGNDDTPSFSKYGVSWYLGYVATLLLIHIFTYFSLDAFTFVFLVKIVLNTIASFSASYVLIVLYSMVVRL